MFLQLQPYDTRTGSWPCCPVQRRNQTERSADKVSSEMEYYAGDIEGLEDFNSKYFMYGRR